MGILSPKYRLRSAFLIEKLTVYEKNKMPRAKRFYIPGYVWHITHRCHKKEFLLKFARNRRRWLEWLYEANKRLGLQILNYMVTSNHIHLLVSDTIGNNAIFQLKEDKTPYNADFGTENIDLSLENTRYWNDID